MPSVLIVDDEADIRLVVRSLVEDVGGWRVAGEADSGDRAVAAWRALRPDVVVLDQRMPGMSGLEVARQILAEDGAQAIVLFTVLHDPALDRDAASVGVRVCLAKHDFGRLMPTLQAQVG